MSRVRVGILGTGTVVRTCHLPALAAESRAQVVAIGNHRPASMEALAREFAVAKTYLDFERMARDPDVDAVVVALPNYLHAPATISLLQNGKHVLCEKPMATRCADAQAMAAAAGAARRKLMIAHVWRSSPQVRWLKQIIAEGRLGRVVKVVGHAIVAGKGPRLDSWFVRPELSGGGALADVGSHSFDTISFLFDDLPVPIKVSAQIGNQFEQLEVEDTADVRVEYDNAMVAEIKAGWFHDHSTEPHGAVEVFGTEGDARTLPARLRWRGPAGWREQAPALDSAHPDSDAGVYAAQMRHFLDCIVEDRQPPCDAWQGVRGMALLEAAYRSRRSGSSVTVEGVSGRSECCTASR